MNRRDILKYVPAIGALTTAPIAGPALSAPTLPEMAELIAIPHETHQAILDWRTAHRESVRAAKAYSDQLLVTGDNCRHIGGKWSSPEDAEACMLRWREYVEAGKGVEITRERMIYALLKI